MKIIIIPNIIVIIGNYQMSFERYNQISFLLFNQLKILTIIYYWNIFSFLSLALFSFLIFYFLIEQNVYLIMMKNKDKVQFIIEKVKVKNDYNKKFQRDEEKKEY